MLLIEKLKSLKSGEIYFFSGIMFLMVAIFIYYQQSTVIVEDKVAKVRIAEKNEEPFVPKYIGSGIQTGSFSHGKDVIGPKISTVELNPIDPKVGDNIILTLEIEHDSLITEGLVFIHTDKKVFESRLELIEGDEIKGRWRTSVKIMDTYERNYLINFLIKSDTGDYEGGISLRP